MMKQIYVVNKIFNSILLSLRYTFSYQNTWVCARGRASTLHFAILIRSHCVEIVVLYNTNNYNKNHSSQHFETGEQVSSVLPFELNRKEGRNGERRNKVRISYGSKSTVRGGELSEKIIMEPNSTTKSATVKKKYEYEREAQSERTLGKSIRRNIFTYIFLRFNLTWWQVYWAGTLILIGGSTASANYTHRISKAAGISNTSSSSLSSSSSSSPSTSQWAWAHFIIHQRCLVRRFTVLLQ